MQLSQFLPPMLLVSGDIGRERQVRRNADMCNRCHDWVGFVGRLNAAHDAAFIAQIVQFRHGLPLLQCAAGWALFERGQQLGREIDFERRRRLQCGQEQTRLFRVI